MEFLVLITVAIIIFSLVFDFINGFHDTANAVATAVSTRALAPRHAILLAAIMNFIGALTFTGVATTITKDIVDPFTIKNGFSGSISSHFSSHCMEPCDLVFWYSKFIISCINWSDCRFSGCICGLIQCFTFSRFH